MGNKISSSQASSNIDINIGVQDQINDVIQNPFVALENFTRGISLNEVLFTYMNEKECNLDSTHMRMMLTFQVVVAADILLNPKNLTTVHGLEIQKNHTYAKLRLQIANPLELIFRKTDNVEVEMLVYDKPSKIKLFEAINRTLYQYIVEHEPEVASRSSVETIRRCNLIQLMEQFSLLGKLSMDQIELQEVARDWELKKFQRDFSSYRGTVNQIKDFNYRKLEPKDTNYQLFFYNLMDMYRRKLLMVVFALFREASFHRKFRRFVKDAELDPAVPVKLEDLLKLVQAQIEEQAVQNLAELQQNQFLDLDQPADVVEQLQWTRPQANFSILTDTIESCIHSGMTNCDLFVIFKCKKVQWRLLKEKADESELFYIYPHEDNQFDSDGDSSVFLLRKNLKDLHVTQEVKTFVDKNSLITLVSCKDKFKFQLGILGIDLDTEEHKTDQYSTLMEFKNHIYQADYEIPFIIITQTSHAFLNNDDPEIQSSWSSIQTLYLNQSQKRVVDSNQSEMYQPRTQSTLQNSYLVKQDTVKQQYPLIISNFVQKQLSTAIVPPNVCMGSLISAKLSTSEAQTFKFLCNGKEVEEDIQDEFAISFDQLKRFLMSYEDRGYFLQNQRFKQLHYISNFKDSHIQIEQDLIKWQFDNMKVVSPESFILFAVNEGIDYIETRLNQLLLDYKEFKKSCWILKDKLFYDFDKKDEEIEKKIVFINQIAEILWDQKMLRYSVLDKLIKLQKEINQYENHFIEIYIESQRKLRLYVEEKNSLVLSKEQENKIESCIKCTMHQGSIEIKDIKIRNKDIDKMVVKLSGIFLRSNCVVLKTETVSSNPEEGRELEIHSFKGQIRILLKTSLYNFESVLQTFIATFEKDKGKVIDVSLVTSSETSQISMYISIVLLVSDIIIHILLSDHLTLDIYQVQYRIQTGKLLYDNLETYEINKYDQIPEEEMKKIVKEQETKDEDVVKDLELQCRSLFFQDDSPFTKELYIHKIIEYNCCYQFNIYCNVDSFQINKVNQRMVALLKDNGIESQTEFLELVSEASNANEPILEQIIKKNYSFNFGVNNFKILLKFSRLTKKLDFEQNQQQLMILCKTKDENKLLLQLSDVMELQEFLVGQLAEANQMIRIYSKFDWLQSSINPLSEQHTALKNAGLDFFKGIYEILNALTINMMSYFEPQVLSSVEQFRRRIDLREFQKNIFDIIYEDIEYYKKEAVTLKTMATELEARHSDMLKALDDKDANIKELDTRLKTFIKDQDVRIESIKLKVTKEFNSRVAKLKARIKDLNPRSAIDKFENMFIESDDKVLPTPEITAAVKTTIASATETLREKEEKEVTKAEQQEDVELVEKVDKLIQCDITLTREAVDSHNIFTNTEDNTNLIDATDPFAILNNPDQHSPKRGAFNKLFREDSKLDKALHSPQKYGSHSRSNQQGTFFINLTNTANDLLKPLNEFVDNDIGSMVGQRCQTDPGFGFADRPSPTRKDRPIKLKNQKNESFYLNKVPDTELDLKNATDEDLRAQILKLQQRNIFNTQQKQKMKQELANLTAQQQYKLAVTTERKDISPVPFRIKNVNSTEKVRFNSARRVRTVERMQSEPGQSQIEVGSNLNVANRVQTEPQRIFSMGQTEDIRAMVKVGHHERQVKVGHHSPVPSSRVSSIYQQVYNPKLSDLDSKSDLTINDRHDEE